MRKQASNAGQVLVINTSPLRQQDSHHLRSIAVPLRRPMADKALITTSAVRGLQAIFATGYGFAEAGVVPLDADAAVEQGELDLDDAGNDRAPLMSVMDAIYTRHGCGILMLAGARTAGDPRILSMRQVSKDESCTLHEFAATLNE